MAIKSDKSSWLAEYNAAGFITKITITGLKGDSAVYTYTYTPDHLLAREVFSLGGEVICTQYYGYENGVLMTRKSKYGNGNTATAWYSYNRNQQLTQITGINQFTGVESKTVFNYDQKGNIIGESYFYDSAEGVTCQINYKNYDDKRNPLLTLKGLADVKLWMSFYKLGSRNNPGQIECINYYDTDGDGLDDPNRDTDLRYTYMYNDGYPIRIKEVILAGRTNDPPKETLYSFIYE
ncbi:hypothetical protein MKJ04_04765 [Pontibacter sp. E15-1]|uniref:hypothetical protein n=1 Tax=Pontibacter sp. E15-1 TaxID=2919918 RepID=UPI001F4F2DE0|nr:hypothetical protein [Pontibacter sp. E15-1]MCJ8164143.1 hypothetical protein [Pontibacter sp. E15-1]